MEKAWTKWARHSFAIAGLVTASLLTACGGGNDADPPTAPETPTNPVTPTPPVTPGPSVASVIISHDAQGSTPPTRVVATFSARVSSILPGLITASGNCTTLPAASTVLDGEARVMTVTLGSFRCDPGQTLKLTVDPSKVQLENATLADNSVWSRSFTIATPPQQIGGSVSGLAGTMTLVNNGGDPLNVSSDGSFLFSASVAYGATYTVSILNQPPGQTCSVSNASGTVQGLAIRNIAVVCATDTYSVGGTVSGLSGSVTLQLNGGSSRTVNANGSFVFPVALAQGSAYAVTVLTQPVSQTCAVANGNGAIGGAVSNVQVVCSTNTYTVGGTVSGLSGALVVQNNGTDNLALNSNGSFTFASPLAVGAPYNTTVLAQPVGQTCSVSNGSGTGGGANITNVSIACNANITTLSISPAVLVLPVNGGLSNITVTNTGSYAATGIGASLPSGWVGVSVNASDCASLAPAASCNLAFSTTNPYVGSNAVAIQGNNTNAINATLGFSVSGYTVYAINGPNQVQVVSEEKAARIWSTLMAAGAPSSTDGSSNTNAIIAADAVSSTAALSCRSMGASWYLPALCQWSGGCGLPSLQTNAVDPGLISHSQSVWSSTELDVPRAWTYFPIPGGGGSGATSNPTTKTDLLPFRCVAELPW